MKYFAFCIILLSSSFSFAVQVNDETEKVAIITQVINSHAKIKNLYVKMENVTSVGEDSEKFEVEWAFDEEKRFLKRQWPAPVGDPPSERFQIGIWDTANYKLYDTAAQTGSVRNTYSSSSSKDVPFNLNSHEYAKFFGKFSGPGFREMFDQIPSKEWQIEIIDSRINLIYATNNGNIFDRWIINPEKNYMVEKYEFIVKNDNGDILIHIETESKNSKEVSPGIWIPTKVSTTTTKSKNITKQQKIAVLEFEINNSKIDNVFKWEFPKDGQATYYDYNIGSVVRPHETEEVLAE